MQALRITCNITCGISILIWLTYGIFYRRNRKLKIAGIVSAVIWGVTSIIVYGT